MNAALAFQTRDVIQESWNPTSDLTDAAGLLGVASEVRTIAFRQVDKELKRSAYGDQNWLTDDSRSLLAGDIEDRVITVPNLFTPRAIQGWSVRTLQEWEGVVESVGESEFTARLRDLTGNYNTVELATIPLDELDPDDLSFLRDGAVFNLIIGYFNRGNGQRRETMIYFRRFVSSEENNEAKRLAALLDEID